MPELVKIGQVSDFPAGKMKKVSVKGMELLIANVGGKIVSIDDVCTHEECSLSTGFLNNDIVTCPCHLSQFNLISGKVVQPPATGEKIPDTKTFSVKVDGDQVLVEM